MTEMLSILTYTCVHNKTKKWDLIEKIWPYQPLLHLLCQSGKSWTWVRGPQLQPTLDPPSLVQNAFEGHFAGSWWAACVSCLTSPACSFWIVAVGLLAAAMPWRKWTQTGGCLKLLPVASWWYSTPLGMRFLRDSTCNIQEQSPPWL